MREHCISTEHTEAPVMSLLPTQYNTAVCRADKYQALKLNKYKSFRDGVRHTVPFLQKNLLILAGSDIHRVS